MELFLQFVARITKEIPSATIAMFSKLKHINAQATEKFREVWNAKYLDGFVVHSKAFDGLKSDFPIGFLVWKLQTKKTDFPLEISCEVLDKTAVPVGEKKFYNTRSEQCLADWIVRPKSNKEKCVPLTSAITPPSGDRKDQRGTKWSDGAVGFMCTGTNDFQNTKYVCVVIGGFTRSRHFCK